MANIAITNYCNLRCKYCFADDMIQEEKMSITMDDFRQILDFLSRTPKNHVGIIGGEPTLHPHFDEILKETNKYCRELNTGATLFTNGTNLEKYLPLIGERIGLLINTNAPQFTPEAEYQKTMDVLEHLADLSWFDDGSGKNRATVGCNVYPTLTDYSYIWEIVDKYHLTHLRTSVVSPGGCFKELRADKEAYFNQMKPIFLTHCENAIKHNCILNMDCGHIPACYFNSDERELVDAATRAPGNDFCSPVVDITSDFRATSCFGAYDPVDIRDFKDLIELERFLMAKKVLPRAEKNCTGRCTTCKKHKLLQCQGGCLGFADIE